MKTSSTATGSGSNVSGGVWLPKGIMLICSSVVNKNFIAPVSLLFRHTSQIVQITELLLFKIIPFLVTSCFRFGITSSTFFVYTPSVCYFLRVEPQLNTKNGRLTSQFRVLIP